MTGLNVAYLTIGTILSFFGVIFAFNQLIRALQKKWLSDQKNTDAITQNTLAVQKLTDSQDKLNALYADLLQRVENLERGSYNVSSTRSP